MKLARPKIEDNHPRSTLEWPFTASDRHHDPCLSLCASLPRVLTLHRSCYRWSRYEELLLPVNHRKCEAVNINAIICLSSTCDAYAIISLLIFQVSNFSKQRQKKRVLSLSPVDWCTRNFELEIVSRDSDVWLGAVSRDILIHSDTHHQTHSCQPMERHPPSTLHATAITPVLSLTERNLTLRTSVVNLLVLHPIK